MKTLSGQELAVLKLIAQSKRPAEIAEVLGLSRKTVATYKYRIQQKLETVTDVGLVLKAIRIGLIPFPEE